MDQSIQRSCAGGGRKDCDSAEMPKYQQMGGGLERKQVSRLLGIERIFAGEIVVSL